MNASSPYYLHPTDTGLKLVSNVFSGEGFKGWKRAITIALSGKNKLGFVNGNVKRAVHNQELAKAWDSVNDVIIGWLLNAVDEKISKTILWLNTAKEIWEELEQRFGQSSSAQFFTIQESLSKTFQAHDMSIEDYFTKIKGLWDELDALDPIATCTCSGCECQLTQKTTKSQQRSRVIQFLMKLDPKYKQTRSSLIMMKELPSLSEIYSILVQEQVHQGIGKHEDADTQDMAMAHRVEKRKFGEHKYRNSGNKKQSTYCDHCRMQGHTMEKCWKLHGYPSRFKNNTWKKEEDMTTKANNATAETSVQGSKSAEARLTQEQYTLLMNLLNKQSSISDVQEVSHTSNSAQLTGNNLSNKSDWVIDSGATDHMCFQMNLFEKVKPLANKIHSVIVPDGRKIRVEFVGDVFLPNRLCLKEVLFVPNFHCNLISVNKLASQLNCAVIFDTNRCVLQEPLRKRLLLGNHCKGLYYLQHPQIQNTKTHSAHSTTSKVNGRSIEEAKLWHLRLGHLPFNKLKLLFPEILDNKVDSNFICTVCPLAKQTRLPFNRSSIQTNDVFQLIHVDI